MLDDVRAGPWSPPILSAVLTVALLVPVAAGTPAAPPWEVTMEAQGAPETGSSIPLTVSIQSNLDRDEAHLWLDLPAGVTANRSTHWNTSLESGQSYAWTWQLDIEREGFWSVGLSEVNAEGEPVIEWCCLFVRSMPGDGKASLEEGPVIPSPQAETTLRFSIVNQTTVEAHYTVESQAAWMLHAALELTQRFDRQDVSKQGNPGDTHVTLTAQLPLAPRQTQTLTVQSQVLVTFERGAEEDQQYAFVECHNLRLEREENAVIRQKEWSCAARGTRSGSQVETLPAASIGLVGVMLTAAALLARRSSR